MEMFSSNLNRLIMPRTTWTLIWKYIHIEFTFSLTKHFYPRLDKIIIKKKTQNSLNENSSTQFFFFQSRCATSKSNYFLAASFFFTFLFALYLCIQNQFVETENLKRYAFLKVCIVLNVARSCLYV